MSILDKINPDELYLELGGFIQKSECAYFPERTHIAHIIYYSGLDSIEEITFEKLLAKGYRRSGTVFYKSICPSCRACIPIRINAQKFKISKSQRRVLRKNLKTQIVADNNVCNEKKFCLMNSYLEKKHDHKKFTLPEFEYYYCTSPVKTIDYKYYVNENLMGVGIVDFANVNISTVYFYFDLTYKNLSPGVFSILKEIEICQEKGFKYYYLGYFIENHPKMNYKAGYKPYELLIDGKWIEFE